MVRTRPALLDVNVLVALFFPDHVHHELAHDWFADHRDQGWATCPITQNGFLRVACQQGAADLPLRPADAIARLTHFQGDRRHRFWADTVSLADRTLFAPEFARGPRQLTDVYLLGLAKQMGGRLATFDRGIPLAAVRGATAGLLAVIEPAE